MQQALLSANYVLYHSRLNKKAFPKMNDSVLGEHGKEYFCFFQTVTFC